MFHVRSIFPDQDRVISGAFELNPTNPQGEAVCSLFEQFLAGRAACFREPLAFLKKGDFELDWSSAPGGVALATLLQGGEPASICAYISGVEPEADAMMLDAFREHVLQTLFNGAYDCVCETTERPLILEVIIPGRPEWVAATQLLSVSLGSVYFRRVFGCAGAQRLG